MAVQVDWDSRFPAISGNCVKTLPQVFRSKTKISSSIRPRPPMKMIAA